MYNIIWVSSIQHSDLVVIYIIKSSRQLVWWLSVNRMMLQIIDSIIYAFLSSLWLIYVVIEISL